MSNPNTMPNSPFEYTEARIFVRHSDGTSLVVPEQSDEIDQLSFKLRIPFGLTTDKRVEAINKAMRNDEDEERDLGFIALQRFVGGAESAETNGTGLHRDFAYGYLGQIHIGKPVGKGTHRQVIPIAEAQDIMNNSPLIDSIDRRLAFEVFRTVEIASYLDLTA